MTSTLIRQQPALQLAELELPADVRDRIRGIGSAARSGRELVEAAAGSALREVVPATLRQLDGRCCSSP